MFDYAPKENDSEGVSAVISVILMIALTVVLAAVVGTFALNLTSQLQQSPQAVVSFNDTYDEFYGIYVVEVSLSAKPNADEVYLRGDIGGDSCDQAEADGEYTFADDPTLTEVGSAVDVCVQEENGAIRAVGVLDGNKVVLQEYRVG